MTCVEDDRVVAENNKHQLKFLENNIVNYCKCWHRKQTHANQWHQSIKRLTWLCVPEIYKKNRKNAINNWKCYLNRLKSERLSTWIKRKSVNGMVNKNK